MDKIIGENILYNNPNVSYLYVIYGFNYKNKKASIIEDHITDLHNMIVSLNNKFPEIEFCLSNLQTTISAEEQIKALRTFNKGKIPYEDKITAGCNSYYILEVFKKDTIENFSIKETISDLFSVVSRQETINFERVLENEAQVYNIIKNYGIDRANKEITTKYILNNYFPGFFFANLNFNSLRNNFFLRNIYQEYNFDVEYFTMENNFLANYNGNRTQYCSIIEYNGLPTVDEDFAIDIPIDNLKVFVKISNKSKIEKKLSIKINDIDYSTSGASNSLDLSDDMNDAQILKVALNRIHKDESIGCECSIVQLITKDNLKDLREEITKIQVNGNDRGYICYPILNQMDAYKKYIKNRRPSDYTFVCDLRYALSFKLDNFDNIGDYDTKSKIGVRIGYSL